MNKKISLSCRLSAYKTGLPWPLLIHNFSHQIEITWDVQPGFFVDLNNMLITRKQVTSQEKVDVGECNFDFWETGFGYRPVWDGID